VVAGTQSAVNPRSTGTKVAAHYPLAVPAGKSVQVRLRLTKGTGANPFVDFDEVLPFAVVRRMSSTPRCRWASMIRTPATSSARRLPA
jgi:hypothetical protein